MFGNKKLKQKINRLETENAMLQDEVIALVNRIAHRDKDFRDLLEEINECAYDCSASLDFNFMNAFSIERIPVNKESMPHTVVGFVMSDADGADVLKEWKLYINPEQHEMLVEEFRLAKSKRNGDEV